MWDFVGGFGIGELGDFWYGFVINFVKFGYFSFVDVVNVDFFCWCFIVCYFIGFVW